MTQPGELLLHAQRLLSWTPPSQMDLRRFVSASYYGLFHLFTGSSTIRFFARVIRTFEHRTMKETCRLLSRANEGLPPGLVGLVTKPIDLRLAVAAGTFVDLQEARHRADCDLVLDFSYDEAAQFFTRVAVVAAWWNEILEFPETDTFLAMLLLGSKLTRNG